MTDEKTTIETEKGRATEATKPTTFNFAAAVMDRSYPEIDVPVYLDEKAAQELLSVYEERSQLETRIAKSKNTPSKLAERFNELTEKYDELRDSLKHKEFIVRVQGIAPEEQIKIEKLAYEAFPKEYTESINPVTGGITRTEVENPDRDAHFANLIRRAHLVSVTSPDGAVDVDWDDIEKVTTTFSRMPVLARAKVDEAINASTITVDFYRELVDEVF